MRFILLVATLLAPLLVSALPNNNTITPPGPNPPPNNPKSDYEKIRYTLSLYPMAVDSKDFSAFSEIFTTEVQTNYGPPLGELDGLPTLESELQSILANVTTLHLFSAPNILIQNDGTAVVVTKVQASHFGQGIYLGQEYLLFGQYRDIFQHKGDVWKISQRVTFAEVRVWPFPDIVVSDIARQASFGNISIFSGQ